MRSKLDVSKKQFKLLYVAIHILAWVMLFLLPFVFLNVSLKNGSGIINLLVLIKAAIIFYINFLILVPRFLLHKKWGAFFLSLVMLLVFNFAASFLDAKITKPTRIGGGEFRIPPPEMRHIEGDKPVLIMRDHHGEPFPDGHFAKRDHFFIGFRSIGQISFVLMLIGVSTSLKLTEQWFKNEKHQEVVKNEQLSTELAFLKSQINPHFLFNSLNSIYSLAHKKSDKAPTAIVQLSKIMRYVIDDANNSTVLLEKELEHLNDYIELQKLRLTEKTKLLFDINNQSHNALIEPMLLVPFIENAFKHGVDSYNISYITIKIDISQDRLVFKSSNTIAQQKTENPEEESGIGLKNVIRRLELLYPNEHKLDIIKEEKLYSVILDLKLKSHEMPDC